MGLRVNLDYQAERIYTPGGRFSILPGDNENPNYDQDFDYMLELPNGMDPPFCLLNEAALSTLARLRGINSGVGRLLITRLKDRPFPDRTGLYPKINTTTVDQLLALKMRAKELIELN